MLLRLEADGISGEPGQFVNIAVEGKYLRRPISVADYDGETLSLIVAPVGEGTRKIVETPTGSEMDMLTGLGNRFTIADQPGKMALFGGGVGYAPLTGLIRRLSEKGYDWVAFFGFNSRDASPTVHLEELKEKYGERIQVATMTGDMGFEGNVVECADSFFAAADFHPDYLYACGPMGMMRAIATHYSIKGEVSLEARMGCGFGACMGCTIETVDGPKRICKEGPVMQIDKLKW